MRFHLGEDRVSGKIYNPYDSVITWYDFRKDSNGYKRGCGCFLVIKPVDADFEIRIAHMDWNDIDSKMQRKLGQVIPAGELVGVAGTEGFSSGRHTHTEIVSYDKDSTILEILWKESESEFLSKKFKKETVIEMCGKDRVAELNANMERKQIIEGYTNKCYAVDYWDGRKKTFYSSRLLRL